MVDLRPGQGIPGDWYPGVIPENIALDATAHIETTYSFSRCHSRRRPAVSYGRGTATYRGTMFDLGEHGRVSLGALTMINAAWIISDCEVVIGDHVLMSWDVIIMDTLRRPADRTLRREELRRVVTRSPRRLGDAGDSRPVRIGDNVWVGFGACVMPGVIVGDGAVVGARSVVDVDVPPYTVVAGNPARPIRTLTPRATRGDG